MSAFFARILRALEDFADVSEQRAYERFLSQATDAAHLEALQRQWDQARSRPFLRH